MGPWVDRAVGGPGGRGSPKLSSRARPNSDRLRANPRAALGRIWTGLKQISAELDSMDRVRQNLDELGHFGCVCPLLKRFRPHLGHPALEPPLFPETTTGNSKAQLTRMAGPRSGPWSASQQRPEMDAQAQIVAKQGLPTEIWTRLGPPAWRADANSPLALQGIAALGNPRLREFRTPQESEKREHDATSRKV